MQTHCETISYVLEMSSAEELAAEYEKDGGPEFTGTSGKRSKAERVEHKHSNPGGESKHSANELMDASQPEAACGC
ncbi:hypothetical protein GCK32_000516 [Trichostrongylus colubriformis]|uniref:Uncharacterized protein n=1 Tax=Trichostrongylus colubriformis TaxID=6319 RepID=A0AAN8IIN9_TRICO